jgi:protein TonB
VADNIFAEPFVKIGGNQKYTVLVSIVAHTVAISAAIIVPLVATDTIIIPSRLVMIEFPTPPSLPPSPPPPRGAAREQPSIVKPTVPLVAPDAIIAEKPIPLTSEPVPGFDSAGLVPGVEYFAPASSPPPSPVAAQVPLRPGGDIKRPVKVKDAAPVYPAFARAARVEGIVIVEATIGPNGKVQDARILRSIQLLDAAALDAVRQWEFTPTLLNGMPIAIVMTVTVDFKLR